MTSLLAPLHFLGTTGSALHPLDVSRVNPATLVVGCGRVVVVEDTSGAQEQDVLTNQTSPVTAVALSDDDLLLGVAEYNAFAELSTVTIYARETPTEHFVASLAAQFPSPVCDLKFSPDSRLLAVVWMADVAKSDFVSIIKLDSGELLAFETAPTRDTVGRSSETRITRPGFFLWYSQNRSEYTALCSDSTDIYVLTSRYSRAALSFTLNMTLLTTGPDTFHWVDAVITTQGGIVVFSESADMCYVEMIRGSLAVSKIIKSVCAPISRVSSILNTQGEQYVLACGKGGTMELICLGTGAQNNKNNNNTNNTSSLRTAPGVFGEERHIDGMSIIAREKIQTGIIDVRASQKKNAFIIITTNGLIKEVHVEQRRGMNPPVTLVQTPLMFLPGGFPTCIKSIPLKGRMDLVIVSTKNGEVELWSLESYSILDRLEFGEHKEICSIAVTPSGDSLWIGLNDGQIVKTSILQSTEPGNEKQIFKLTRPNCVINEAHKGPVRVLDISVDGKYLASSGIDGLIRVWDASTGQAVCYTGEHTTSITSLCWDSVVPELLHSSALDRTITCHQVASSVSSNGFMKKVRYRLLTSANIVSLKQVAVGECELLSVDTLGTLRAFDFDVDTPTLVVPLPSCAGEVPNGEAREEYIKALLAPGGTPNNTQRIICSGKIIAHLSGKSEQGTSLVSIYTYGQNGPELSSVEDLGFHAIDIEFTPDARQLIVIGSSGEIGVFDYFGECE